MRVWPPIGADRPDHRLSGPGVAANVHVGGTGLDQPGDQRGSLIAAEPERLDVDGAALPADPALPCSESAECSRQLAQLDGAQFIRRCLPAVAQPAIRIGVANVGGERRHHPAGLTIAASSSRSIRVAGKPRTPRDSRLRA
ncbi:MAG TPA: hypothetical protein VII01_10265 [Solirubrobacteraceae bacterium]